MTFLFSEHFQAVNSSGAPYSGAKLYFYQSGTTTDITTYQDSGKVTPHANPVVADAAGLFAPIWIDQTTYKFVLKTSADVTIQTVDAISGNFFGYATAALARDALLNIGTGESTDNAIVRYDGTAGAHQNSSVTIDDSGNMVVGGTGISRSTTDGSDNSVLALNGGGARSALRGASVVAYGNEEGTNPGVIYLETGTGGSVRVFGGPLYVTNGSASAPSMAFENDTNSGFYRVGADQIGVSVGGVDIARASAGQLTLLSADAGASGAPTLSLTRQSATPAASDILGVVQFMFNDSAANADEGVTLKAILADPTTTSEDVNLEISTVVAGTFAVRFYFGGGLYSNGATGGDKGAGTINAQAVYDDNVLLTCYPFDAYLDGDIDEAKWDAKVPDRVSPAIPERKVQRTRKAKVERIVIEVKNGRAVQKTVEEEVDEPVVEIMPVFDEDGAPVMEMVTPARPAVDPIPEERDEKGNIIKAGVPGKPAKPAVYRQKTYPVPVLDVQPAVPSEVTEARRHEDMRKFKKRLGTADDPLSLEKYIQHWKTKRHLSSLPNEANFDPIQGMPTGSWIQRLIETAEIQAIHDAQLLDRVAALEAKIVGAGVKK